MHDAVPRRHVRLHGEGRARPAPRRSCGPSSPTAGCLFVVSAFESVDDATLERLDKGHTTADAALAVDDAARPRDRRAAVVPAVHAVDDPRRHRRAARLRARARPRRQRRPGAVHDPAAAPAGLAPARPPRHHAAPRRVGRRAPHLRVDVGRPRDGRAAARLAALVERSIGAGDAPTVEIYAQVREAVGARAGRPRRVHDRSPPPHRELVLLRRTDHRAAPGRRLHRSWTVRHSSAPGRVPSDRCSVQHRVSRRGAR